MNERMLGFLEAVARVLEVLASFETDLPSEAILVRKA